jgi:hypothetical protein
VLYPLSYGGAAKSATYAHLASYWSNSGGTRTAQSGRPSALPRRAGGAPQIVLVSDETGVVLERGGEVDVSHPADNIALRDVAGEIVA